MRRQLLGNGMTRLVGSVEALVLALRWQSGIVTSKSQWKREHCQWVRCKAAVACEANHHRAPLSAAAIVCTLELQQETQETIRNLPLKSIGKQFKRAVSLRCPFTELSQESKAICRAAPELFRLFALRLSSASSAVVCSYEAEQAACHGESYGIMQPSCSIQLRFGRSEWNAPQVLES